MIEVTDKPNLVYRLIGGYIHKLADIGATDEELILLFNKGQNATLKDIAQIEEAHTHFKQVDA